MRELTRQMRSGACGSPEVEALMLALVKQLETVRGKRKYGYLLRQVKATVDENRKSDGETAGGRQVLSGVVGIAMPDRGLLLGAAKRAATAL